MLNLERRCFEYPHLLVRAVCSFGLSMSLRFNCDLLYSGLVGGGRVGLLLYHQTDVIIVPSMRLRVFD